MNMDWGICRSFAPYMQVIFVQSCLCALITSIARLILCTMVAFIAFLFVSLAYELGMASVFIIALIGIPAGALVVPGVLLLSLL